MTGGKRDDAAGEARDAFSELVAASPEDRASIFGALSPVQKRELATRWEGGFAHVGQTPEGDGWRIWVIRAGRGFGKTRAGAEWISQIARDTPDARLALVGATRDDVRRVMIEGQSGLIAVARDGEIVSFRRSAGEVHFPSGAVAYVYAASAPEQLRGPEHHAAWCDELGKWKNGETAWDNLTLTLRIGDNPRMLVTTTPRANPLMRRVLALKGLHETRGASRDNPHLPRAVVAGLEQTYAGTRFARQELDGEMVEDAEGALWTRALIERCREARGPAPAEVRRVVVGVDPPAGIGGDACGIVAVALDRDEVGHVIEDASVVGASPEGWARAVADCAARVGADRVVAEKNQGGEMVRSVLQAANRTMPLTLVHASRGKVARAEPVAALYERGRMRHAGVFGALEDELCGLLVGGGYEGPGRSPDRADALVWAATHLVLEKPGKAAVRGL